MGVLRLLLDTHCWVWLRDEWPRLPSPLRRRLQRDPTKLVLSAVSVIEIGIKHATGRLNLGGTLEQFVAELMDEGVTSLGVNLEHALRMATLPPLHRDPFDRLLVAQAMVEGLTLVSADANVLAYDVPTLDARK